MNNKIVVTFTEASRIQQFVLNLSDGKVAIKVDADLSLSNEILNAQEQQQRSSQLSNHLAINLKPNQISAYTSKSNVVLKRLFCRLSQGYKRNVAKRWQGSVDYE